MHGNHLQTVHVPKGLDSSLVFATSKTRRRLDRYTQCYLDPTAAWPKSAGARLARDPCASAPPPSNPLKLFGHGSQHVLRVGRQLGTPATFERFPNLSCDNLS